MYIIGGMLDMVLCLKYLALWLMVVCRDILPMWIWEKVMTAYILVSRLRK